MTTAECRETCSCPLLKKGGRKLKLEPSKIQVHQYGQTEGCYNIGFIGMRSPQYWASSAPSLGLGLLR